MSKSATRATGNSPASKSEDREQRETLREKLAKKISENPKWREAPPSGKGYVIGGAKPVK